METSTHARIKGFRQLFAFAIGGGIQGIIFAGGGGGMDPLIFLEIRPYYTVL